MGVGQGEKKVDHTTLVMKVVEIEVLIELFLVFLIDLETDAFVVNTRYRESGANLEMFEKTATTSLRVRQCFDSGNQPSQLANEVTQILSINRINA